MPIHGVPATDQLIEEIKDRMLAGKPSMLELARFKKRAAGLKASDPETAYLALAMIACAEDKISECSENHKKSTALSRHPSIQISNHANSMLLLGRHEDAIALSQKAREIDMLNTVALDIAIKACFNMGDEQRYLSFIAEWKKNKGEEHPSYAKYLKEVEEANELTSYCMRGAADIFHEAKA